MTTRFVVYKNSSIHLFQVPAGFSALAADAGGYWHTACFKQRKALAG
jgi:hypothetical protein